MVTVLSKRKPKAPKKIEPKRGCFRSCVAWFVYPLPTALFFMILMFVWSSSTTYISGRIMHVCVSSRKLTNLYCLSATTQPNDKFQLPFTNSSSPLENGIPVFEEKLKKSLANSALDDNSVNLNRNLKGESKEDDDSVVRNQSDGNNGLEAVDDLKGDSNGVSKNPLNGSLDEIKNAREVVEEYLRVQRSWAANQNWNQNQNQCYGRGIYVYELPPKFNKDLVAQCHDMVPWVDMCNYFSNNALGEPIPELGNRWFKTHQYSLELIFHSRVLKHPCRVYDENQAKLFYVPYYGGLDILRWHFKNVSNEVKDTLSYELVNWLEMQKSWDKNLEKDHVFVLGKISWDFKRKDHTSWGTRFLELELEEMQNPIKLMIERQPWELNDIGIPHPTHFHPHSDDDIRAWQRKIISSNRRSLISFAGAARPDAHDNIRAILIDQCTSATEEQCKFFDCKTKQCDEPKSLIGLFTESEFCLQLPGDSPTRKSVFDSLVSGCIPVLFDPFTAYYQYPWHLPEDHGKYSVFIDQEEVRKMKVNVVERLMKVPLKERDDMRRNIVYDLMPKLVYGDEGAKFELFQDAFSITMNNVMERVKSLKP
ncbi:xyloglucan-specific galacturonosyltransferase 1 [Helianthus annuus]|uniref:xyloglucan-specific galacturonosyltransferase 1 n=1 Tax=Helianthus annuus TaxID=4232 RepID=UPI000B8FED63|nr:xyloglucan-specific galacturonosyltransferase 1 [Helianthus annuus]